MVIFFLWIALLFYTYVSLFEQNHFQDKSTVILYTAKLKVDSILAS